MRILAGRWAGRTLVSPAGRVRPTSERLRAAWMAMLAPDLAGARVVDLFAGSGAVGIESLSRGAASCDFVENHGAALHALKANVASLKLKNRVRIFKRDAIVFLGALEANTYDIVLADPPYGSRKLDRVVRDWLADPFSRVLAVEHAPDHDVAAGSESVRVDDSMVTVLRRRD